MRDAKNIKEIAFGVGRIKQQGEGWVWGTVHKILESGLMFFDVGCKSTISTMYDMFAAAIVASLTYH